jgi:hypothetical protein
MLLLALMLACDPAPTDDADADPSVVDEDPPEDTEPAPVDSDGDGYFSVETGGDDCDDANPAAFPGAPEVWYDGVDQACNGNRDDGDQDGDGHTAVGVGGDDCNDRDDELSTQENAIESARPRNGAADVLPSAIIEIELRDADARAQMQVVANGASVVPGTVDRQAKTLTFTPDAPWAPDTEYEVSVRSLCSLLTTTFSTSQLGQPLSDLDALVGSSWKLDVRSGVMTQPPLFGSLITGSVQGWEVITLTERVGDQFNARFSYADRRATEQDLCLPAIDLPRQFDISGNPTVTMEPDAQWYLGELAGPGDSFLTGMMRPDGSEIINATWSIYTDLRDVYSMFGAGTATQICAVFATAGFSCQPCADGTPVCMETRFENLELVPAPFALVERLPADILLDPACVP